MKFRAVIAIALATLFGSSDPAPLAARATSPQSQNHCQQGERVVYTCSFGGKIGSVCLGSSDIHYRFGRLGIPEIDIRSDKRWGNIHLWGNRSQAGLNQNQIRFTRGNHHYVVFAGETGSLNEQPGVASSGIAVILGSSNDGLVVTLDCKAGSGFNGYDELSASAPKNWNGWQADEDPFNAIY